MNTIREFIEHSAVDLGLPTTDVRQATGGILNLIKQRASSADSRELIREIPGAEALLGQSARAAREAAGRNGMLGGLKIVAGSLLGGKAVSTAAAMGLFEQAHMGTDEAGSLASMFFQFAKSKVRPELVGRIVDQIPELKMLVS